MCRRAVSGMRTSGSLGLHRVSQEMHAGHWLHSQGCPMHFTSACTLPGRRIKLGSYSEADARRLVREMVRAVAQCHGMNVMLRDIKPENVRRVDGVGGWGAP